MFGARFAVFVRRARVLPSPCYATRNSLFLEVSPALTLMFQLAVHRNGPQHVLYHRTRVTCVYCTDASIYFLNEITSGKLLLYTSLA